MIGDASEYEAQICLGINVVELRGADQATDRCGTFADHAINRIDELAPWVFADQLRTAV
ncbi:hypothetical protein OKW46_006894 [Paraburkholderia sp. WSM4179]|nr:hypothetical protein [Paraburkholderia sp. WSM4179]